MKIRNYEDWMDDETPIRVKVKKIKAAKPKKEWDDGYVPKSKPKGKQKRRDVDQSDK